MKEFGFVYDSSIPAPLSDPPLWPYTLDYKIPHKCIGDRKCPSRYGKKSGSSAYYESPLSIIEHFGHSLIFYIYFYL